MKKQENEIERLLYHAHSVDLTSHDKYLSSWMSKRDELYLVLKKEGGEL